MNSPIDTHFIHHLEMKLEKISLKRVDADVMDKLIEKEDTEKHKLTDDESAKLKSIFEKAIINSQMHVRSTAIMRRYAVTITMEEWMRRMKDMSRMGGGGGMNFYGNMPDTYKVSVNANHKLVNKILSADEAQQTVWPNRLLILLFLHKDC
jgi:molecular chaperone HtpG